VYECESIFDGHVMDRHECIMSASTLRLSTSMREYYLSSWRRAINNDDSTKKCRTHWQ
jgi:hypothetical protein